MILQGKPFLNLINKLCSINIECGKSIARAKENSIIFFPYQPNTISCGISAFVAFKGSSSPEEFNLNQLKDMFLSLKEKGMPSDGPFAGDHIQDDFLGGMTF